MVVLICFALHCSLFTPALAQNDDFKTAYEAFRRQAITEYEDFRQQANAEYAAFMEQAWKESKSLPAVRKPKEEDVPPVIIEDEEEEYLGGNDGGDDQDIKIHVIRVPKEEPQPTPISPIHEQDDDGEAVTFDFFNTTCKVRLGSRNKFRLAGIDEQSVAAAWRMLSGTAYDNAVRDCLELRIRLNLCDWAYLLLLNQLSQAFCGANTNEATLLMAYLYCQSGYQMRLVTDDGWLRMLYSSKHNIYNTEYFSWEGVNFYPFNFIPKDTKVCQAVYPAEQPLSLLVGKEQRLGQTFGEKRTLCSARYPEVTVTVSENTDLMEFYETYPPSYLGDNHLTRWAMYANTPINLQTREPLYNALRNYIRDKSELEAVNILLNWVQTAFVYEYDNKVWGDDRAFFADETLYYPYCDCEDRAILLSRLVRDLLGLDMLLVYYPGHLAAAVCFNEEVSGDAIMLGGRRFVIADPTFIGASVGRTMSGMDNKTAQVILLEAD